VTAYLALAIGGGAFRLAMAVIFVAAAAHALSDRAAYLAAVENYRLAPVWLSRAAAGLLPPLQLLTAILLIWRPADGVVLGVLLLVLFAGAMAVNVARGRTQIECGCGGPAGQHLSWAVVGRNLGLAALLGGSLGAPPASLQGAAALVGLAGAAVCLSVLYFAANQLLANAQALAAGGRA
jgi:hypothetical protein